VILALYPYNHVINNPKNFRLQPFTKCIYPLKHFLAPSPSPGTYLRYQLKSIYNNLKLMIMKTIKLYAFAVALATLSLSSCKKEDLNTSPNSSSLNNTASTTVDFSEKGTNPDENFIADASRSGRPAFLYVQSNSAGENTIMGYRMNEAGQGKLAVTVSTGAAGKGETLFAQGTLATDENKQWLFAVNAGANSISSFRINSDGTLALAGTVSSGGTMPVSLTVYKQFLYVVNSTSANIMGFKISGEGMLTPIQGTNLRLSSDDGSPAQIAFSPYGKFLYVTEKVTHKIDVYKVDADGRATTATSYRSLGQTPFGFTIARNNFMIVANANGGEPTGSSVTSYCDINQGRAKVINGELWHHQSASCMITSTKYGRFAFVSNKYSNNISSFYISPGGAIFLVNAKAATTGMYPTDITVSADNAYVYVINERSHNISVYKRTFLGGLQSMTTIEGLPEFATGLVAL
jgi:6-phosphogluconolactonase (cycloisomerase 2 family)